MHAGEIDVAHRLDRIDADGRRLLELAGADLSADVPTCPGWTAERLVGHMGRVWNSVTAHVESRATEAIAGSSLPRPPEGAAVVEWSTEALSALLAALGAVDADDAVWTWAGPEHQRMGCYHRRMHIETLVHRIDAERTVGVEPVVLAADAADGIDELCMVIHQGGRHQAPPTGSLHLHRTDGDGEWTLVVEDGTVVATRDHTKGDAAVRGPADRLLLAMTGRGSFEGLDVFGDAAVAAQWAAISP